MVMTAFGGMAVGSNARVGRMVYRIPSPPEWVQTLHYEPAESNTYTKLVQELQVVPGPLRWWAHACGDQDTRNPRPAGLLRRLSKNPFKTNKQLANTLDTCLDS